MSIESKAKRPPVDWESVEFEYRAGLRSLKGIGAQFSVSAPAIVQRAKKYGWERDLSAKIKQAAENKVNAAQVNSEVNAQRLISERQIVEANATLLADTVLNQRTDIKRYRSIVQKLWELVDTELNHPAEFAQIGEMLRSEDEFGNDKLNDIYRAAISLPQQIKNVKLLADAIKVLIELERKVLRIDEPEESSAGSVVVTLSKQDVGL